MTSNRINFRHDDTAIELTTTEDILREVQPGDFIRKSSWGSYYRVAGFKKNEVSQNTIMYVFDSMGYQVSYIINGVFLKTWFKKVEELRYVPTQEGDRENDI